jgi:choloylglycine hydrolase
MNLLRTRLKLLLKRGLVLVLSMLLDLPAAYACTDVHIAASDGSVLSARSMEFGPPLGSRLVVRPRGSKLESPAPNGANGLGFIAKYGYAYMDGFQIDAVTDGLNEAGLSFGALYLPGFAEYESVSAADNPKALSNLHLGAWVLSQFATVAEVKAALGGVKVWGEPLAIFNNSFVPLHFAIHDASGKSLVLEWVGGKLTMYESTAGVLTNSPPYDWQMLNLRNFVSLSPDNAKPVKVNGVTYPATGQGSGLFGLPGDPTPPSRLVQTAVALAAADKPKDHMEALVLAQKLMNRVDLPAGLARDPGSHESDITQWVVFRDHASRVYYYRTYEDMTLRALDLKKTNLAPGALARRIPIATAKPTVHMIDPDSMPVVKH